MQGDFSRTTFDGADAYRSVLLQQGRVLLDADWNEQADITAHHDETRTSDVVGGSGGAVPAPGEPGPFALVTPTGDRPVDASWDDLRLAPGTYYVAGVLCENGTVRPLTDRPLLPSDAGDLAGVPRLPEPEGADPDDRYALYLEVWSHHVTGDEDPALVETALGGPDTTTRARTVWRARTARLEDEQHCQDLHRAAWLARTPRTMTASLADVPLGADPCTITTAGGYQGLENQLYRVQVHEAPASDGTGGTFLWSRDNGSVVARVLALEPGSGRDATLTLDRVGRDEELSFGAGSLVEVTSSDLQLRGRPGHLAVAGAPADVRLPVTWLGTGPASLDELGAVPVVRRWDRDAAGDRTAGPSAIGTAPVELEAGISVAFGTAGDLRTGDYWLVPARTVRLAYGLSRVSGTIEWPPGGRGPLAQPPAGPGRRVAPLAILRRTAGGWTRESDCRRLFPRLTDLVGLDLVGGDGQQAMPGVPLPEPVRVVVRNGGLPVAGAPLAVSVAGGHVSVTGTPGTGDPSRLPERPRLDPPPRTDGQGVLEIRWLLDPAGAPTQTMTVRRLDDHGDPVDVPVVVTGRLSVADQVAWTPPCDGFAGTQTVQAALEQLATTTELRLLGGDGQSAVRAGDVLPEPVGVVLDSPCGPVEGAPLHFHAEAGGRVARANLGDARPDTLEGSTDDLTFRAEDGIAWVWWQPGFAGGSSALRIDRRERRETAGLRVTAQLTPPGNRTPGVHIVGLSFLRDGKPFRNDTEVPADTLAGGILLELDDTVNPLMLKAEVVRVTVDVPWPLGGSDGDLGSPVPVGSRTIELLGDYRIVDEGVFWQPRRETAAWLHGPLFPTLRDLQWKEPLAGRFVVDGWGIASEKDPERHLNGHARAVLVADPANPAGVRTELVLPTDDEVTGGQFVQWFRLTPPAPPDPHVDQVEIPDVGRHTLPVAQRILDNARLTVAEVRDEPSVELRRGLVLRTEPEAGTFVPIGSGVVVIVSTGRRL